MRARLTRCRVAKDRRSRVRILTGDPTAMLEVIRLVLAIVVGTVRGRQRVVVENLLLGQQLQVVRRSRPRPRLRARDTLQAVSPSL